MWSQRKAFLDCKPGKKLGEDLHLNEAEKNFSCKFSKVNNLGKMRSRACRQEEAFLKFGQVQENVKGVLVSAKGWRG